VLETLLLGEMADVDSWPNEAMRVKRRWLCKEPLREGLQSCSARHGIHRHWNKLVMSQFDHHDEEQGHCHSAEHLHHDVAPRATSLDWLR